MECQEYLEGYSEYLDERLDVERRATFRAHQEGCSGCRRYDRVIRRGVKVWRSLPEVEPSPDFLPRLRHRLYHVDDAESLAAERPLGSAALVAVAAVGFLALAWLPFATQMSVEVQLPAVAVEAPVPEASPRTPASLFGPGPFLTPASASPYGSDGRRGLRSTPSLRPAMAGAVFFDPYRLHTIGGGTVTTVASDDAR